MPFTDAYAELKVWPRTAKLMFSLPAMSWKSSSPCAARASLENGNREARPCAQGSNMPSVPEYEVESSMGTGDMAAVTDEVGVAELELLDVLVPEEELEELAVPVCVDEAVDVADADGVSLDEDELVPVLENDGVSELDDDGVPVNELLDEEELEGVPVDDAEDESVLELDAVEEPEGVEVGELEGVSE